MSDPKPTSHRDRAECGRPQDKLATDVEYPVIETVAGLRAIPIPCAADHDVVYGLAAGAGDEIYLAPSNEFAPGLCAVVLAYDVRTEKFRTVIDVQKETGFDPTSGLMPHSKIHLALKSTSSGRVFAATHFTAPGIGQSSFDPIAAYRGKYPGCFLLEYNPDGDRVINHGLLLKGEGARIACIDEQHHQFYFISYPRNHLYRYDYERRNLYDLGRVGQENAFGLEVDRQGNVHTSDDRGRILRYSPANDRLEELNLFVPLAAGRRSGGNYIRRMTAGLDGKFYGFANKGMRLFELDPERETLEDLGVIHGSEGIVGHSRPLLPPAKALVQIDARTLLIAFGGDGVYLDRQPVPNLIRFDLIDRRATNCGKFVAVTDGASAWIPQCALAALRHGAVFFGMQQTAGPLCLWQVDTAKRESPHRVAAPEHYQRHCHAVLAKPFGTSVEGSEPLPFVRRGHVHLHELGWAGEDQVVPPGETGIASLCWAGQRTLYGLTTGRRPHLFCFEPHRQNRFTENYEAHPWDLGVVASEPACGGRLWHDVNRNQLLIALQLEKSCIVSSFVAGSENSRYRGVYHSLPHWPPVQWDTSPFRHRLEIAEPALFENLSYLSGSDSWISTTAKGEIVSVAANGDLQPIELDRAVNASRLIAIGPDRLFAITTLGGALVVQVALPDRGAVVVAQSTDLLASTIVAAVGRAPIRPQDRLSPSAACVAIGTRDGLVTVLDLERLEQRANVRLRHRWKVRTLAWDERGYVHGFYGEDNAIGEAFTLDPRGGVTEVGILQVSSQPRFWMCHRCDAMAAGPRGEVYFGESDRLAHLFSFIPEPTQAPLK